MGEQAAHRHKVRLTFDGCFVARLICPEDGNCPRDEESGVDECSLLSWFEAVPPEDLLAGEIDLEVDATWGGYGEDGPTCEIVSAALAAKEENDA